MSICPEIQTLDQTLWFHVQREPDKIALVNPTAALTYRQLEERSNQIAHGLKSLGLPPGSRVAYLGQEHLQYYELIFACAKSQLVIVPINWRLTAVEVQHILADSGTAVLVCHPQQLGILEEVRPRLSELRHVFVTGKNTDYASFDCWAELFPVASAACGASADDPVAQLYTSGTTGLPKGVVLAHRSFFKVRDALLAANCSWIDWRPDDRAFIGIPGFHVGGLWWSMQAFNAGVTCVSVPTFSASLAVRLIEQLQITTLCVVPAMIQMMLGEKGASVEAFRSVRKVVYGGSPISEPLLEQALSIMQAEFAQIYGLTETGNTAVCLPPEAHVAGSPTMKAAGRPYPGFQIKIIDGDGNELQRGEIGEVCINTPARMLEYWNKPEETARTLQGEWIHTGDAGYVSADGYLYICDRIKDVIIVAGENVYPAEVEKAIMMHPAVLDAAVIGVPDERWGEGVVAYVVPEASSQIIISDVIAFLRKRMADFKVPKHFELIDAIPRNPSGKILRRVLRDPKWASRERQVN